MKAAQTSPAAAAMPGALAPRFVADYFLALGRPDLAAMSAAGNAGDFPEMAAAHAALSVLNDTFARYEAALTCYADREMWDDSAAGGPLALHDAGQMARNVLSGRAAFHDCE